MQAVSAKSCVGVRARVARRTSVQCNAAGRRELLGLGAALIAGFAVSSPAMAGLTEDLLAKSSSNKELNDKKRLLTSSANVARSRTVADGTCQAPLNFFGCETSAAKFTGGVKFIKEDYELECEGTKPGLCASQVHMKWTQ